MDNIQNIINDPAEILPVPPSEVLSNELILEHIFKNLGVGDLKHCRGVNIFWCREATKSLLKNHELSHIKIEKKEIIRRKRRRKEKRNFQFRISKGLSMGAEDFVAMVSTSISFPCNKISLWSYALENTTIQSFFNSYGGNIKQLEIWNEDKELGGPIVKMIEDLLTKQVTKLKCLKIQGGLISALTKFLNDVRLRNLSELIVGTYKSKEFIGRILKAAVNLKTVNSSSGRLEVIVGFGKAHLLDCCDFIVESSSNIEEQINVYEAVVNSKPKLKTVSLNSSVFRFLSGADAHVSLLRFASIISKCLELNSENLVNIYCIDNFLRLPGLQIPRLAKVKSLESEMHPLKLMEENLVALSFVKTFPNLKSIAFSDIRDLVDPEEVCNYLGNVIPSLTVTHCNYWNGNSDSLPPTLFGYFGDKFPNLTHLECGVATEFLEASQHIWSKLTKLEFLEIQIGYTPGSVEANYPGLEAAFTGFSSETCLRLKNCITEEKDANVEFPNLEELRTNPSILNLKKLTCLKLTFDNQRVSSCPWENWAPTYPLLTAVTGRFAFALCPSLRVNMKIRAEEGSVYAFAWVLLFHFPIFPIESLLIFRLKDGYWSKTLWCHFTQVIQMLGQMSPTRF